MIDDFRPVRPPVATKINTGPKPKLDSPDTNTEAPSENAEPAFVPPPQVAARDDVDETIDLAEDTSDNSDSPSKPPKKHHVLWQRFRNWFSGLSKRQQSAFVGVVILLIGGLGGGAYALFSPAETKPQVARSVTKTQAGAKVTTVPSNLTGLPVAPELNNEQVTAVMIENSTDARPQAGLSEAGIVYEAIAEGGITRFMALYQDTAPASVGPIRSIRPYYLDWAMGYEAAVAHVGGSPEALQNIKNWGVKDLDQSFNAGSYERVKNRYAPHNVFTSLAKLNELEKGKGFTKSTFNGFKRKAEKPSAQPNAKTVTVNTSSQKYNSQYSYDAASNSYLRNMAGGPHNDATSGKQIAPKSVVVLVVPYSIQSDGKHSVYGTIGSGEAYVFQDGVATKATWQKTSREAGLTLVDAASKPVALNAGQTWVSVIGASNKLTYQP